MLRTISTVGRHYTRLPLYPANASSFSHNLKRHAASASAASAVRRSSNAARAHADKRHRNRDASDDSARPSRSNNLANRKQQKRMTRRRFQPAPTVPPTRICVSPEGLSSRQLAALAKTDPKRIFENASAIEPDLVDDSGALGPELVELLAEQMKLNLIIEKQTPLFRPRTSIAGIGKRRMPVVTVMGHVDHGKTSLLDALRHSNIAEKEAGGITQNIGAFEVPIAGDGGETQTYATFIDTPGHAAFSTMRAFGAVATDVVILVVAADDGVMPQTVEAVNHAKAAGVPIVVAINKCDKPGADPERVRYQLLELTGLHTEQLGGDVQCVEVSAKEGSNLDTLMETVLLQSEMLDLEGNAESPTEMICIESKCDRALGSIATVVIRSGTLKVGDFVVFQSHSVTSGDLYGRVRSLVGMNKGIVKHVGPGKAVGIVGIRSPVPPGSMCIVVSSEKEAKKRSHEILAQNVRARATIELAQFREESSADAPATEVDIATDNVTTDHSQSPPKDSEVDDLDENSTPKGMINVVIKGDVQGSADAVALCLSKLGTKRYGMRVLAARVGDVNDNDLALAAATAKVKGNTDDALIVAFNVRASGPTVRKARKAGVDITQHKLIYHLEDEVKSRIEDHVKRWETTEKTLGKAQVVRVFNEGAIGGCSIDDGSIAIGSQARVLRFPVDKSSDSVTEREIVYTGVIGSLKHFSKDIRVASKGTECGVGFVDWSGFMPGDIVESVEVVKGTGR